MPLSKNMQIHDIMNSYLNNDKVTLNLNNFKFKHRCSFHISVFSSSSSLSSFFFFVVAFRHPIPCVCLHFDFSNSFISFRFAFHLYLSLVFIIIVVHYNNKFAKWKSIQVYIYLFVIHWYNRASCLFISTISYKNGKNSLKRKNKAKNTQILYGYCELEQYRIQNMSLCVYAYMAYML